MNEVSVDNLAVKKFEDYRVVNHEVANQWDVLVSNQKILNSVRPIIASSWERCLSTDVEPSRNAANEPISKASLEENFEKNHFLLQVALPYVEKLYEYYKDTY